MVIPANADVWDHTDLRSFRLPHKEAEMAIDFQRQRAIFPSHSGSAQSVELAFVFASRVGRAETAVNGFSIGFSQSDHHLFRAQVDTTVVGISNNVVRVRVDFALRDSSGTFDDRYDGFVDVMAIVDRT
jgi:hypothetical protein